MPIHSINGRCHTKKLKSCRTGLTDHTGSLSHHITPLVIIGVRWPVTLEQDVSGDVKEFTDTK